ncbi:Putative uncharacterized protein [Moritella viscosa]|nr:Putative uncharacterized protein [Moritella viscosa]
MAITFKIGTELQTYILQMTEWWFRIEIKVMLFDFTLKLCIVNVYFFSFRFIAL